MTLIELEHSPSAYRLDFVLYGLTSLAMAAALVFGSPAGSAWTLVAWVLAGGLRWTLAEYLLHRFVLHGVSPFKDWHAEHHRRPTALIGTPTWITATLFVTVAALPAWALLGAWPACALTFGLLTGYLVYGLTHHATHHGVPGLGRRSAWLARRRRWHAQHHAARGAVLPGHYGVSLSLWDHAFGTLGGVSTRA